MTDEIWHAIDRGTVEESSATLSWTLCNLRLSSVVGEGSQALTVVLGSDHARAQLEQVNCPECAAAILRSLETGPKDSTWARDAMAEINGGVEPDPVGAPAERDETVLERVLSERSELRRACIELAAPMTWATDGSTASAIHHIRSYVERLEAEVQSLVSELAESRDAAATWRPARDPGEADQPGEPDHDEVVAKLAEPAGDRGDGVRSLFSVKSPVTAESLADRLHRPVGEYRPEDTEPGEEPEDAEPEWNERVLDGFTVAFGEYESAERQCRFDFRDGRAAWFGRIVGGNDEAVLVETRGYGLVSTVRIADLAAVMPLPTREEREARRSEIQLERDRLEQTRPELQLERDYDPSARTVAGSRVTLPTEAIQRYQEIQSAARAAVAVGRPSVLSRHRGAWDRLARSLSS